MKKELEIRVDPNRTAAEMYLRHLQTPTCVIVAQAEMIGSERVVNAHNIYMNRAALQQLSAIYPDNEQTGRSTEELVRMCIQALTETLPESQRPTITIFQGNPDGETALAQSSGVSLGYTSGANMQITQSVVNGLFHVQD